MELDSIKTQLRDLEGDYTDDSKSDDDIIYAVYNWVKSAHIVSQLLLLEGRFPELWRCLDLCDHVLQERHVLGEGRRVVTIATGEDGLLMESLRVRTLQLQRQCEEARRHSKGRDTTYYMNKLLRCEEEDPTRAERPATPPERGVSFGRRTRLNRWRVPPILPPLVTQSHIFLRPTCEMLVASEAQSEGIARRSPRTGPLSRSYTSSPNSRRDFGGGGEMVRINRSGSEGVPGYAHKARTARAATMPPIVGPFILEADGLHAAAHAGEEEEKEVMPEVPPKAALPSSLYKWQRKHLPPQPQPQKRGQSFKQEALRPFSAPRDVCTAAVLPTGETGESLSMLYSSRDANGHGVRSSIAMKAASEARLQVEYNLQALEARTAELVESDSKTANRAKNLPSGVVKKGSERCIQYIWRSFSEHSTSSLASTLNYLNVWSSPLGWEENNGNVCCSSPSNSSDSSGADDYNSNCSTHDSVEDTGTDSGKHIQNDTGYPFFPQSLSSFGLEDLCTEPPSHASLSALKQLRQARSSFLCRKKELAVSTRVMRDEAEEQRNLFRPSGRVVLVEDTAVWKSRRRLHGVAHSNATVSITEPTRQTATTDVASLVNSAAGRSGSAASSVIPLPVLLPLPLSVPEANAAQLPSSLLHRPHSSITTPPPTVTANATTTSTAVTTSVGDTHVSAPGVAFVLPSSPSLQTLSTPLASQPTSPPSALQRLRGMTHVENPDIHAIVTARAERQALVEARCRRLGSRVPRKVGSSQNRRESMWAALDQLRQQSAIEPIPNLPAGDSATEYGSCLPIERTDPVVCVLPTLEVLRDVSPWEQLEPASLATCFPLHLATVRLQCVIRRFLAQRQFQRMRDAIFVEYVRVERWDRAAIVLQCNARRVAARRMARTMQLRVSYRTDQRVLHEACVERIMTPGVDDALPHAESGYQISLFVPLGDAQATSGANFRTVSSSFQTCVPSGSALTMEPAAVTAMNVGAIMTRGPQRLYGGDGARRLRTIQRSIASRVIARALRRFLHGALRRWESETRSLLLYTTGRLRSVMAFVPRRSRRASRRRSTLLLSHEEARLFSQHTPNPEKGHAAHPNGTLTGWRGAALQQLHAFEAKETVFPIPPDRLRGDVIQTWERGTAEARRLGDTMTPLEHVRLSALQSIRGEREAVAAARRRREAAERMAAAEEQRRQQRAQLEAVLVLQRAARGFGHRRLLWRHVLQWRRAGRRHRRAELLSAPLNPADATALTEAEAIPLDAAAAIATGIRRRNPKWFDPIAEARRARRATATVTLQAALRGRGSVQNVADRYCGVAARVIQRAWRAARERRRQQNIARSGNVMEFLHSIAM